MNSLKALELFGSLFGVIGALIIASNPSLMLMAYYIMLASSILLMVFSYIKNIRYIMVMNVVYLAINILGIYNNTNTPTIF